jgi:hypothetical protein
MISTTYKVTQEVASPERSTVTLKVVVVDEVIGVYEGYTNTTTNKVVVSLPPGYSTLDLVNAIRTEGFDL